VFQRPRGTRDFLPGEMRVRRRVLSRITEVFESYGYGEVLTPAFEHLELLEAKAGPEIKEQIYWFEDKAGRRLGLRFELTTPIARIVASRPELPKPIRLYYVAPVWRYEEPQRGRLREFWQAGVELIGASTVDADAETAVVMYRALEAAGLDGLRVRVNSRRIADGLARRSGVPAGLLDEFYRIVDKLEKQGAEAVASGLRGLGLGEDAVDWVLRFITFEADKWDKLDYAAGQLGGEAAEEAGRLRRFLELLIDGYGVPEEGVEVDLSIVRGIGYYTGIVYEASAAGAEDVGSLAGGGRYDDLIRIVGGPPTPATGMAIGVERVIEALVSKGAVKMEEFPPQARVMVVSTESGLAVEAVKTAEKLRRAGVAVAVEVMGRSIRAAMSHANRSGVKYVVIVGRRELEKRCVSVKDMEKGVQREVPVGELVEAVASGLRS